MATTDTSAVELHSLMRTYGRGEAAVHALRGIDLTIPRGSLTAVMGRPARAGAPFCRVRPVLTG